MSYTELQATTAIERLPTLLNGGMREIGFLPPVAKTAAFTVWTGDASGALEQIYLCTGTYAATLEAATSTDAALGRVARIKNNGVGTITITPAGSDTIEGAATLTASAGDCINLLSDGTSDWVII